jgi:hypothetical protein
LFHQPEGLKQLFVYLLQAYSLRRCFAAGVKRGLQPSHEVFEAFSLWGFIPHENFVKKSASACKAERSKERTMPVL